MTEPSLTLGHRWTEQYLSGMILLHTLLGKDVSITPKAPPTLDTLVQVLQEISSSTYDASKYFDSGPAPQLLLIVQPPPLSSDSRYAIIGLNALTPRSQFISVTTGGIVFEDPLWAILAAHALSKNISVALPMAKDNNDLWKRISVVAEAVKQRTYKPEQFLGAIEGFVPPLSPPKFELLSVDANQLAPLRDRGVQALKVSVPPKFFELFQLPPNSEDKTK